MKTATAKLASKIPAHVPEAIVHDFDFVHDPRLNPDPHLGLIQLLNEAPGIFWTPAYGGHWVVQSHEAVDAVVHDWEVFSSVGAGSERGMLPISSNPPEHREYRGVMLQQFSPKNVNAMLPTIHEWSDRLIDTVARQGHGDFLSAVGEPLPVGIFMKIIGMPLEMMGYVRKTILESLHEGDIKKRNAIWQGQLDTFIDPLINQRIAKREDDLMSRILDSDIFDRKPTFDEMQRYMLLLVNAGLDTVTNAMCFAIRHLAADQDLQQRIREDRSLIPAVVEEVLRRYGISSVMRQVAMDAERCGVQFRKGEHVHILLQSANLDSHVYENPAEFILGRGAPPVTFGTGVHRCLGSHLARLEMRIMLNGWFDRVGPFRLDPENMPTVKPGLVYAVESLPLLWKVEP